MLNKFVNEQKMPFQMNEQEQKDRAQLKNELRSKINALQDEVENNWNGKISQESIAKLIGVKSSYLSRLINPTNYIDATDSLKNANNKLQALVEKFVRKDTTKEESENVQIELSSDINKPKEFKIRTFWLTFFITLSSIFFISTLLYIKKSYSYQKEIDNIKYWYTSPDSVLAETYPFLRGSSEFMLRIDVLKEQSMASIKFTPSTIDGCVGDPSNSRMFTTLDTFNLFGKIYVAGKFFIMEGRKESTTLIDDSQLEENYVDSIPTSFIHTVTKFIDDKDVVKDKSYLSNILKISEPDNAKIFANLAYIAVLDTGRQVMVRFPAYKEYKQEEMANYKFEDRPWSPFKYERDTSYLTQPYGDIRSGLMPVRTYVEYYHKIHEGRKIKIAIGVDLIYAVEERGLFGLF